MFDRENTPFWILTLAFSVQFYVTNTIMRGMYMDGLLYSSISRNLAIGSGGFWETSFHEHPPLVFGIEACFFRIFGDGLAVERGYCLLVTLVTLCLILLIWKEVCRECKEYLPLGWLACLCWCLFPLNVWSYANNMLEPSMTIFSLASIYMLIKYVGDAKPFHLTAAALLIGLGFLSKGPAALFPLFFFVSAWLALKMPLRRALSASFLMGSMVLLAFLLLISFDAPRDNLYQYFMSQVLPSLQGQRYLEEPRTFFIIKHLALHLAPHAVLVFAIIIMARVRKIDLTGVQSLSRWIVLFFLIGLSASLPIALSKKQSIHYLVPSFPYYALGFALLVTPAVKSFVHFLASHSKRWHVLTAFSFVLLVSACIFVPEQMERVRYPGPAAALVNITPKAVLKILFPGSFKRIIAEENKVHDVELAGRIVPPFEIVTIDKSMQTDYSLHGYFSRLYNISLSTRKSRFLFLERSLSDVDLTEYKEIDIPTIDYRLFRTTS